MVSKRAVHHNRLAAVLTAACLLLPLSANAAVLYDTDFDLVSVGPPPLNGQFTVEINNNNAPRLDFQFFNLGPTESFISRIYFQEGFGSYLNFNEFNAASHITHSGGGTWTTSLESNPQPVGVPDANWFAVEFIAGGGVGNGNGNQPEHGVHPYENVTLSFALLGGVGDLLNDLVNGDLYMALRIMGQEPNDWSASYLNNPGNPDSPPPGGDDPPGDPTVVPVPPAVAIGLMGFAMVGMTRWRKRSGAAARS